AQPPGEGPGRVGWVERSEPHRPPAIPVGLAALDPPYKRRPSSGPRPPSPRGEKANAAAPLGARVGALVDQPPVPSGTGQRQALCEALGGPTSSRNRARSCSVGRRQVSRWPNQR